MGEIWGGLGRYDLVDADRAVHRGDDEQPAQLVRVRVRVGVGVRARTLTLTLTRPTSGSST